MTVPPKASLIELDVVEAAGADGEPPVGADRHVERRRRGGVERLPDDLADALERRARRARAPARARARPRAPSARARRRRARSPAAPTATSSSVPGVGAGRHGGTPAAGRGPLSQVEDDGREVDAADPVDEGVMGLEDQREAPVVEAFDEPQLPQRPAAVERGREDAREQLEQLARAPRARAARRGGRGSRAGSGRRRPTAGGRGRARCGPAAGGSAARGAGVPSMWARSSSRPAAARRRSRARRCACATAGPPGGGTRRRAR